MTTEANTGTSTGKSGGGPARPDAPVVLEAVDLHKSYGDRTALAGVSVRVHEGEIIGLVGPNGAGKTTFLECVEGIRRPDRGTVTIAGLTRSAGPAAYHLAFGAQLQESSLAERLRVVEAMELFAAFYDDPWDIGDLLERIGLTEHRKVFYRRLSGGQKRRLTLALALLGRPPVLLLDEPTTGLDPHARLEMWGVLEQLTGTRTAVLLATHDLHEAQSRCHRVYVLDGGRIAAGGPVGDLLGEAGLITRLRLPDRPWLPELLGAVPGWTTSRIVAGTHYAYGGSGFAERALAALRSREEAGTGPADLRQVLAAAATGPTDLEDLYLTRTGAPYEPPIEPHSEPPVEPRRAHG
ncbi:ABC transporter ATP-binding protein [Streptomyces sp. TRM 70361]|uniref:ABC transporter ATP-binding protein n=1 Tax=Streptomyces sp. TRM 70361 TaxID=3116553 RepID=UPI002E7AD5B1|nr:ABC transporter ATP-binding protein [Streptomyces sp. TRM 70361]MEE1940887.1 ABC transporter ATP-binding protein [Streptomyces sp. TRM 70361]